MNSDEQIIRGCQEGKRKAYGLLYKKYAPVMLGVCMRYCKTRIDAEDVMQDAFIKVFTQIGKFRSEGSFEGWIKRIMIHSAIDNYQANLKHFFHEDVSGMEDARTDDESYGEGLPEGMEVSREKLMQMIQELPDGYRMVFNLFAIENYNHKDIAAMLGISESTSKTQLLKARKALRKKLENYMESHHIQRITTI
jgi:RNA polymerase sigma-70 factor (ECF subfamily)